jgi:adenylate cyclase
MIELDLIAVKGKSEALHIFALLGDKDMAASAQFKTFANLHAAMLSAYRARSWNEAEHLIAECREASRNFATLDDLYDLYASRIALFRETPPPADWDGVFVATSK